MVDVEPTVEIVLKMADTMEDRAQELRSIAKGMREHNDLTSASDVVQCVVNMVSNLRLDLMVTRPLRAKGER